MSGAAAPPMSSLDLFAFAAATSNDKLYFGCGPKFPVGLCACKVNNQNNLYVSEPPSQRVGGHLEWPWCDSASCNTYCGNIALSDASYQGIQDPYNAKEKSLEGIRTTTQGKIKGCLLSNYLFTSLMQAWGTNAK
ncbi:uncharacterized protein PGTG_16480 [Puccinia graminis f. sp. tritici CRL 75-36-700-3]|uniref:Uncharacterized protein n=1 Tax=Puccinia graminis f. sp. tritici (strain CRL 75-36-700-3 / race SCCL) TaxID=418459 RepID=E3L0X7_PUCGT|nr:uncharacterized protein PGTG_16480 [Puccinia graminis f. sp. tritici CRL 75-36-700-3]EFP90202.1 hypothetical protein PGTG_16480 [Puccinia graminis f. sp. tritici CRL 75-36-700-3]